MLSSAGRSPRQVFRGTDEETLQGLLAAMRRIAAKYPGNAAAESTRPLPYLVDLRRALNVAACDGQPLVIVSIGTSQKRATIERNLARLAWSPDYRGRFAFARVDARADLAQIEGHPRSEGVFVVQPGTYGLSGNVIATARTTNRDGLRELLDQALERFVIRDKGGREIREGLRMGVCWESESIAVRAPDDSNKRPRQRGRRRAR